MTGRWREGRRGREVGRKGGRKEKVMKTERERGGGGRSD